MDKKRVREMARIEWQKEKEATRRARNQKKQTGGGAQPIDEPPPAKEASSETIGSR